MGFSPSVQIDLGARGKAFGQVVFPLSETWEGQSEIVLPACVTVIPPLLCIVMLLEACEAAWVVWVTPGCGWGWASASTRASPRRHAC